MKAILLALVAASALSGQAFDAASVKPGDPKQVTGPRIPNGDGAFVFPACARGTIRVDARRFSAENITLYSLIVLAYGIRYSCFIVSDKALLSGGPKWVLTERFNVEAALPADTPAYSLDELDAGAAPALQAMLRNLLKERFRLEIRKKTKEMSAWVLTAVPGSARPAASRPAEPHRGNLSIEPDENKEFLVHVVGNKQSVADFGHVLEAATHGPVMDHSGFAGEYSFDVKFAALEPFSGALAGIVGATSPTIFTSLREIGLKLEHTTAAVDAWVIESAEKPSGN